MTNRQALVRAARETGEVTAVLAANQQSLVEENFERLEATGAETDEALRMAADILANPPA